MDYMELADNLRKEAAEDMDEVIQQEEEESGDGDFEDDSENDMPDEDDSEDDSVNEDDSEDDD